MRNRVLSAVLFTALSSSPVWGQSSSGGGGTVPETMSGYHPSVGYGSLTATEYNGWTKNTGGDISQHSQPSVKSGGSSATYASRDEIQLIQKKIASRRTQQARRVAKPSQPAGPEAAPQQQ